MSNLCHCGKALRHRGRCKGAGLGVKRAPFSTAWRRNIAKAASKPCSPLRRQRISESHVGVPARSNPDYSACKALPLAQRRFIHQAKLALLHAGDKRVSFDFLKSLMWELIQPEPDPCQRLIEKEEWEAERKYWLWRRSRPALAALTLLCIAAAPPLNTKRVWWNPNPPAEHVTQYRVYDCTCHLVATTPTPTYRLATGKTYFVKAVNKGGESLPSKEVRL